MPHPVVNESFDLLLRGSCLNMLGRGGARQLGRAKRGRVGGVEKDPEDEKADGSFAWSLAPARAFGFTYVSLAVLTGVDD